VRLSRLLATAIAGGVLAGACGSSTPNVAPQKLLAEAKAKADGSSGVRFTLTSSGVSLKGQNIIGGKGDLIRPDSLEGSFTVAESGLEVTVKVVSVNGTFEVLLPFASHYQKANPAAFGLTDPAQLLSPTHGLTSLLALARNPRSLGDATVAGQVVEKVAFDVPGQDIPVLPDADPSVPVSLVVAINPKTFELVQVTLTGPLTSPGSNSTYVLTLSHYDERLQITLPPTS